MLLHKKLESFSAQCICCFLPCPNRRAPTYIYIYAHMLRAIVQAKVEGQSNSPICADCIRDARSLKAPRYLASSAKKGEYSHLLPTFLSAHYWVPRGFMAYWCFQADGTYKPRFEVFDGKTHDIANLAFRKLPQSLQYQNLLSTRLLCGTVIKHRQKKNGHFTSKFIDETARKIHDQWRSKQFYFANTKLESSTQNNDGADKVPYNKLSQKGRSHHTPSPQHARLCIYALKSHPYSQLARGHHNCITCVCAFVFQKKKKFRVWSNKPLTSFWIVRERANCRAAGTDFRRMSSQLCNRTRSDFNYTQNTM